MERKVTAEEIFEYCKCKDKSVEYIGDLNTAVSGFSSLSQYKYGTVTWIKNRENFAAYHGRTPSLCIVQKGIGLEGGNQIISSDSRNLFFGVIEDFWGKEKDVEGTIGKFCYIGDDVKIGERVMIGNGCSIDGDISIGDGTVISDNVVIKNRVEIGSNCHIQALAVIGEDGFGWTEDEFHKKKMIGHCGGVKIGNGVFIGSHVNIARGVIDDTVISDGVKIAPSTHIGHNNFIGEDAIIICSQLYGSVYTDNNAYVVGSVVRNHSVIGKNAMVGMGSIVTKNVLPNKTVIGNPAREMKKRGV